MLAEYAAVFFVGLALGAIMGAAIVLGVPHIRIKPRRRSKARPRSYTGR